MSDVETGRRLAGRSGPHRPGRSGVGGGSGRVVPGGLPELLRCGPDEHRSVPVEDRSSSDHSPAAGSAARRRGRPGGHIQLGASGSGSAPGDGPRSPRSDTGIPDGIRCQRVEGET